MIFPKVADDHDQPAIVALPKCLPLVPGEPSHKGRELSEDMTSARNPATPIFSIWFKAMKHLHHVHESKPLHAQDAKFTWSKVED